MALIWGKKVYNPGSWQTRIHSVLTPSLLKNKQRASKIQRKVILDWRHARMLADVLCQFRGFLPRAQIILGLWFKRGKWINVMTSASGVGRQGMTSLFVERKKMYSLPLNFLHFFMPASYRGKLRQMWSTQSAGLSQAGISWVISPIFYLYLSTSLIKF